MRARPAHHGFEHRVSYVWLDPDAPASLTGHHPLWSHRRPAPARFRASDYGRLGSRRSLADQARDDLEAVLGRRPAGAVRMLTQLRRWGWLFNPITVVFVWDAPPTTTAGTPADVGGEPVGVVLEVTNTPWKERTRYAAALTPQRGPDATTLVARVGKTMHVSPFLDEDHEYHITVGDGPGPDGLRLAIDVVAPADADPVLRTSLVVHREPATRASLARALRDAAPTHRVSAAIHLQAARLWRKGVPFVPHPAKRSLP